jgi:hypothetical protein
MINWNWCSLLSLACVLTAFGTATSRAQLSVSVNSADYMPATAVALDFGVSPVSDSFDPSRFFLIDVRNTTGKVLSAREQSTNVQPTFWVQGASTSGQFNLKPNDVRTIRIRAKTNVEGKYDGVIEWKSAGTSLFKITMSSYFGPTAKQDTQDLPRIEACCYKDWTRKDITLPIPDNYRLTGFDSPNNWGPDHSDMCCGWRETSYVANGQVVLVHYGIQADENQIGDHIMNRRALTPKIRMTFGLLESSIGFSITAPNTAKATTLH